MIFLTSKLMDDVVLPGLKIAPKSFRLVQFRWPTSRHALQETQVGSRRMPTTHLTTPPLATRRNLHFCHVAMWCGALSKTLVLPQTRHRFSIVTVTFCDILWHLDSKDSSTRLNGKGNTKLIFVETHWLWFETKEGHITNVVTHIHLTNMSYWENDRNWYKFKRLINNVHIHAF